MSKKSSLKIAATLAGAIALGGAIGCTTPVGPEPRPDLNKPDTTRVDTTVTKPDTSRTDPFATWKPAIEVFVSGAYDNTHGKRLEAPNIWGTIYTEDGKWTNEVKNVDMFMRLRNGLSSSARTGLTVGMCDELFKSEFMIIEHQTEIDR
jgi:hypothetical protein